MRSFDPIIAAKIDSVIKSLLHYILGLQSGDKILSVNEWIIYMIGLRSQIGWIAINKILI